MTWQRQTAAAEDEAAREALIAAEMEFTEISDEARAEIQQNAGPVIEDLRSRIDPAVIDQVLTEAVQ